MNAGQIMRSPQQQASEYGCEVIALLDQAQALLDRARAYARAANVELQPAGKRRNAA